MKKNHLLFVFLFLITVIFSDVYANATVKNDNQKQEKTTSMEVVDGVIIVDGDIAFKSYIEIPYDLKINGNVTFGDNVKVLGKIFATGDISGGNNININELMSGNNVSFGNKLIAKKIISKENMTLRGDAIITQGVLVGSDFSAGSDLKLYGNSQIGGNMKVELDTEISGTIYVYGDLRSKENFHFHGDKLKVYGDFRTLKDSEVIGRIFMYARAGYRSYYTNKIKYNYILKSTKYTHLMGEIDPIFDYSLSQAQIKDIHEVILSQEKQITEQKSKILSEVNKYSNTRLIGELDKLAVIEAELIKYIDNYISAHPKDIQEWKIIQYEREYSMKSFINNYLY